MICSSRIRKALYTSVSPIFWLHTKRFKPEVLDVADNADRRNHLLGGDILLRAEDAGRSAMLVTDADDQAHPALVAIHRPDLAIERETLPGADGVAVFAGGPLGTRALPLKAA